MHPKHGWSGNIRRGKQLASIISSVRSPARARGAIGLYELSRRREAGLDSSLSHAFDVLHSPSLGAIIALGVLLMAIFLIWLVVAEALYIAIFGYAAPTSIEQFITDLLTTPHGWTLIIVRWGIGFLFAALVLSISAISFPLLLDRDVVRRSRCTPRFA